MSKQSISTFEAVAAACDAITEAGGRVTVRAVMNHIGGGSPNRVLALVQQWRDRKPQVEARKKFIVDERVGAILAEQLEHLLAESRKEADAARDDALSDAEMTAESNRELEAEAEANEARIVELEQQTQRDVGVIAELRAELEKIRAEAADAVEKARAEAAAEREKNDLLTRQVGALQTSSEALEAKSADLAARLSDALSTLDAERQARVGAEKTLAVLEARLADSVGALGAATQKLGEYESALSAERAARAAAEASAAASKAQADERAHVVQALEARIKDWQPRVTDQ